MFRDAIVVQHGVAPLGAGISGRRYASEGGQTYLGSKTKLGCFEHIDILRRISFSWPKIGLGEGETTGSKRYQVLWRYRRIEEALCGDNHRPAAQGHHFVAILS